MNRGAHPRARSAATTGSHTAPDPARRPAADPPPSGPRAARLARNQPAATAGCPPSSCGEAPKLGGS